MSGRVSDMAMDDFWIRFTENLSARVSGPMSLRLFLQPTMATIFAIRSGLKDARSGRPPFLWSFLTDAASLALLLREGWKDVGKVFLIALCLDVVYQIIVARFVYPGEAIVVAILLALLPYLIVRGLVTRIARKF